MDSVKIGGIEITCDPDELIFGGRKRGSVHRCIDGSTVIQDRGFSEGDQTIQLKGRIISNTVVQALFALYRAVGGQYSYTDFKGNSATVAFVPGMDSFTVRPIKGSNVGYDYTMSLIVISGQLF